MNYNARAPLLCRICGIRPADRALGEAICGECWVACEAKTARLRHRLAVGCIWLIYAAFVVALLWCGVS